MGIPKIEKDRQWPVFPGKTISGAAVSNGRC
jgi:hypothetical protein